MSKKEKKKDGEKKGKTREKLTVPPVTLPEEIAAPESTPVKPPAPKAPAKPKKAAAPKAKSEKSKPKAAPKKEKKASEIVISNDDIALRAYFIAERRHRTGAPGDETSDWVEAERLLREEARKK